MDGTGTQRRLQALAAHSVDVAGEAGAGAFTSTFWRFFAMDRVGNLRALEAPAFAQWWANLEPISDKNQVVLRYEVGISRVLNEAGLKLASAFSPTPQEKLRVVMRSCEASGRFPPVGPDGMALVDTRLADGLNPTHFFWDALLEEFAVVKVELLRKNPFRLDLRRFDALLEAKPEWRALVDDAIPPP